MSRLLGLTVDEVNADRVEVARRAAAKWGHVVVLKGAFTVMATPDGKACVNPHATPALATAGTGDVLAGLIVGFMAQGLAAFDAAIVATYLHAQAGKEAAEELGDRSVMAGDVLEALPRAYEIIEESPPSLNY
jgi:NAD(P)H-hydrate epimerase